MFCGMYSHQSLLIFPCDSICLSPQCGIFCQLPNVWVRLEIPAHHHSCSGCLHSSPDCLFGHVWYQIFTIVPSCSHEYFSNLSQHCKEYCSHEFVMCCQIMFAPVIGIICFSQFPIKSELFFCLWLWNYWFEWPSVAAGGWFLPVWIVCRWQNLAVDVQCPMFSSCHWWHHMIDYLHSVMNGSIIGRKAVSVDMKKCPPDLLLVFNSLRYDALLWMDRIISLAWYMTMALLFVAA